MEQDFLKDIRDGKNIDPIVLQDESGRKFTFELVAVISYGENEDKRLYVILHPLDKIEGINEGEAIAFRVKETGDGGYSISMEEDLETANAVFAKYHKLLEKSGYDISKLID